MAAAKAGLTNVGDLLPRVATVPFSSERQYMATLHRDAGPHGESHVVLVKGSVERVLGLCEAQMDADGSARSLAERWCCTKPEPWRPKG